MWWTGKTQTQIYKYLQIIGKKFALLGLSIQSITQLSSMVLKVGGGALMGHLEKGECSSFMN